MRDQRFFTEKEFEEKVVQVNRVSKKTKGGNRIGFSVVVVVGDKKGRVAVGLGKAPEVGDAVKKAITYAKKHFITVPMRGTTIPHEIFIKLGAAKILLKPAREGTGVIAGGAVRAVVEAAGIRNIVSKILGTNNQASNVYATLEALKRLKGRVEEKIDTKEPEKIPQNQTIPVGESKTVKGKPPLSPKRAPFKKKQKGKPLSQTQKLELLSLKKELEKSENDLAGLLVKLGEAQGANLDLRENALAELLEKDVDVAKSQISELKKQIMEVGK